VQRARAEVESIQDGVAGNDRAEDQEPPGVIIDTQEYASVFFRHQLVSCCPSALATQRVFMIGFSRML
jgi:hypothetical protein